MIAETHGHQGDLVLDEAKPMYALNFDGFDGLDTTVWFDHVEIYDDEIVLSQRGGEALVTTIENEIRYTEVGSALRAIESGRDLLCESE